MSKHDLICAILLILYILGIVLFVSGIIIRDKEKPTESAYKSVNFGGMYEVFGHDCMLESVTIQEVGEKYMFTATYAKKVME